MAKVHESELEHPVDESLAKCKRCGRWEETVYPKNGMCKRVYYNIQKEWTDQTSKVRGKSYQTRTNLILLQNLILVAASNYTYQLLGHISQVVIPTIALVCIASPLTSYLIGHFQKKYDKEVLRKKLEFLRSGINIETAERITAELKN